MKRYEMSSFVSEHADGEWVWIKDHEAEVLRLKQQLRETEDELRRLRAYHEQILEVDQ
jgi:hypothetical protein